MARGRRRTQCAAYRCWQAARGHVGRAGPAYQLAQRATPGGVFGPVVRLADVIEIVRHELDLDAVLVVEGDPWIVAFRILLRVSLGLFAGLLHALHGLALRDSCARLGPVLELAEHDSMSMSNSALEPGSGCMRVWRRATGSLPVAPRTGAHGQSSRTKAGTTSPSRSTTQLHRTDLRQPVR